MYQGNPYLIGKGEVYLDLHLHQQLVMDSEAEITVAAGGKRGGKSICGPLWSWREIEQYPHENHMIVYPYDKTGKQAALDLFFKWCEAAVVGWKREYYLKGDGEILLPPEVGRGKIYVRSADNEPSLDGGTIRSIWVDEGGDVRWLAWNIILSRIATGGRILITTSPSPKPHGKWLADIYKEWKKGELPNWEFIQWNSEKNKYVDQEKMKHMRKSAGPRLARILYDAQFGSLEGTVYEDAFTDDQIYKRDKKKFNRRWAAVDFGLNFVWLEMRQKGDKFYVHDSYYERRNLSTPEKAKRIVRNFEEPWICYYDDSRPDTATDLWSELKSLGWRNFAMRPCGRNRIGVHDGITRVRTAFRTKRLFIHSRNVDLISEFREYRQKEDGTIIEQDDHGPDCVRYILGNVMSSNKPSFSFHRE